MSSPKLIPLILFSLTFAFIEASVVVYLRQLLGYTLNFPVIHPETLLNLGVIAFVAPGKWLFPDASLSQTEILREFATLIVLAAFAWGAGSNLKRKLGTFLASFALWDIFYYVFLKILLNWPKSLYDIDVFFLLPVPSVGPVLTALVLSTLFLILGIWLFIE